MEKKLHMSENRGATGGSARRIRKDIAKPARSQSRFGDAQAISFLIPERIDFEWLTSNRIILTSDITGHL
jgi:hypothetical protein